jgi:hypothetical protein
MEVFCEFNISWAQFDHDKNWTLHVGCQAIILRRRCWVDSDEIQETLAIPQTK